MRNADCMPKAAKLQLCVEPHLRMLSMVGKRTRCSSSDQVQSTFPAFGSQTTVESKRFESTSNKAATLTGWHNLCLHTFPRIRFYRA